MATNPSLFKLYRPRITWPVDVLKGLKGKRKKRVETQKTHHYVAPLGRACAPEGAGEASGNPRFTSPLSPPERAQEASNQGIEADSCLAFNQWHQRRLESLQSSFTTDWWLFQMPQSKHRQQKTEERMDKVVIARGWFNQEGNFVSNEKEINKLLASGEWSVKMVTPLGAYGYGYGAVSVAVTSPDGASSRTERSSCENSDNGFAAILVLTKT